MVLDDSICARCGHAWHGLPCFCTYGPTDAARFPHMSLRGHACGCATAFVDRTLEAS